MSPGFLALQETLDRHPRATQARNGLGIAHLQANRAAEALMAFERSVELQADFDLAWYGKGLARYSRPHGSRKPWKPL